MSVSTVYVPKMESPCSRVNYLKYTRNLTLILCAQIEASENCQNDALIIYDGPDEDYAQIGKFCGFRLPDIVASSNNSLFLKFSTDHKTSRKGFNISYFTTETNIGKIRGAEQKQNKSEIGHRSQKKDHRACS